MKLKKLLKRHARGWGRSAAQAREELVAGVWDKAPAKYHILFGLEGTRAATTMKLRNVLDKFYNEADDLILEYERRTTMAKTKKKKIGMKGSKKAC